MKKIMEIYKKYEEKINYLIFGVLTTFVNLIVYALCTKLFSINYMISNIIAWILSVLFAYITNKKYVFKSKCDSNKKVVYEIFQFFKYRVLSFIICDMLLLCLFVELLNMNDMIAKVIIQVVVIVLNYLFSKLFVFKK